MRWGKFQVLILLTMGIAIAGGLAYYSSILSTPKKITKTSGPPKIDLLYPKGGEKLNGLIEISWSATDPDNDVLGITIQYTSDPEPFCSSCAPQKWHDVAVNESNDGSFLWNTTMIEDGRYLIKVIASDGNQTSEDKSGWITINNR